MKIKSILVLLFVSAFLVVNSGFAMAAPLTSSRNASISLSSSTDSITITNYDPQPGDVKLQRGPVYIDMSRTQLVVLPTDPTRVNVVLYGNLPTPCHQLRVVVRQAELAQSIYVQAYSVFNPNLACIQVLQPFVATVSLGSFLSGYYTVYVNGVRLGSFSVGPSPISTR